MSDNWDDLALPKGFFLFDEDEKENVLKPSLTVGTQLFELYLSLQQF